MSNLLKQHAQQVTQAIELDPRAFSPELVTAVLGQLEEELTPGTKSGRQMEEQLALEGTEAILKAPRGMETE